jgi:hypothetical protein
MDTDEILEQEAVAVTENSRDFPLLSRFAPVKICSIFGVIYISICGKSFAFGLMMSGNVRYPPGGCLRQEGRAGASRQ